MDLWICFFILLFCTVMYLLYIKGLAVSKSIQAILCVFRPGKDADRATLDSCTGWVRHVAESMETEHTSLPLIVNCRKEMQRYSY